MSRHKLYILVRGDLSGPHRAVQAGHAVAEWCKRETKNAPEWRWTNGTLVYLQVANEATLVQWQARLGAEAVSWREPYWNDQLTAIAHLGKHEEFETLTLMR